MERSLGRYRSLPASPVDDPEAEVILETIHSSADERLLVLTVDDATLVNALQRRAAVVLQKSIREGFGLTVAEAMWKGAASSAGTSAESVVRSRTAKRVLGQYTDGSCGAHRPTAQRPGVEATARIEREEHGARELFADAADGRLDRSAGRARGKVLVMRVEPEPTSLC